MMTLIILGYTEILNVRIVLEKLKELALAESIISVKLVTVIALVLPQRGQTIQSVTEYS